MSDRAAGVLDTLGRLKKRLNGTGKKRYEEKRQTTRAVLRIPIHVRVGQSEPMSTRLRDISPAGLCFEGNAGELGDQVWIRFEGYPQVCESFVLSAKTVRISKDAPATMAVVIDRADTRRESLIEYRKLVLHYLRHKPLLEEKENAFVEARCPTCGWVGRVPSRKRVCSRCGLKVKVIFG